MMWNYKRTILLRWLTAVELISVLEARMGTDGGKLTTASTTACTQILRNLADAVN